MNILYVEDNAVNLSLIQRIAQMNRHHLVSYEEAETALDALEKGLEVDLILLDIQLAGEMDGIGFAKVVRQRGYVQPIIAITAYAMLGDKERIIEAGCTDYLPKPLPIAEFLTLLAKYDPALNPDATPTNSKPQIPTPEKPAQAEAVQTPPTAEAKAETKAEDEKVIATPEAKAEAKPDPDMDDATMPSRDIDDGETIPLAAIHDDDDRAEADTKEINPQALIEENPTEPSRNEAKPETGAAVPPVTLNTETPTHQTKPEVAPETLEEKAEEADKS